MSLFQCIIIFGIVFWGELYIPEAEGYIPNFNGMVYPGRPYTIYGYELYEVYAFNYGPSRHFTIVFTVFVMMQVFNMINSRKINDEWNILEGLVSNCMFVVIWFVILIVQILLSQFSRDVFKCA